MCSGIRDIAIRSAGSCSSLTPLLSMPSEDKFAVKLKTRCPEAAGS
jgi:hypothetical protein